jgi:hypothetical protein
LGPNTKYGSGTPRRGRPMRWRGWFYWANPASLTVAGDTVKVVYLPSRRRSAELEANAVSPPRA